MNSSGMRANAVLLFMQPCPPKFTLKMTPDRARHLSGLTSETPMPLLMIATTLVAQTAAYWGNRLPAPGVFGRNPIEEAIGIFLYMILPAVVGVLVTRIASYIWASRVRPQTLVRSAWTASVAVGVLVSAACWLVTLSAYLIYTQSTRNVATFFINVTLAAILVVPAVLMFGLNLVVYLVCQNLNVKPIVLNFLVYAGSSLSLVLQYLWLREGLSH